MYVKEIWRYPAKSMAGERLTQIEVGRSGLAGDRKVLVQGPNGRVISARTHPRLLGLKGTTGPDGQPHIAGHLWSSPEALEQVREAVGAKANLIYHEGPERFDVLPLLVATDGAIDYMGFDGRRLRPNIVIGGVGGLEERNWPNHRIQIGEAVVAAAQLRGRCVMTTYDPDTLKQDLNVLKSIVRRLDGVMALDCSVVSGGTIHQGDPVTILL